MRCRYLAPCFLGILLITFISPVHAQNADAPRLEKRGETTQLIVDGKPYLILGAEVHNSSSSSLDYMQAEWPRLAAMGLNTVLTPVSWELIEPN